MNAYWKVLDKHGLPVESIRAELLFAYGYLTYIGNKASWVLSRVD
jgi:hypothetical protein